MMVASCDWGKKLAPRAKYAVWRSGVNEIRYSSSSLEIVPVPKTDGSNGSG